MKLRRDKSKVRSADVDIVLQLASGRSLVSYLEEAKSAVEGEVDTATRTHNSTVVALREASARQQAALAELSAAQTQAAVVARVAAAQ